MEPFMVTLETWRLTWRHWGSPWGRGGSPWSHGGSPWSLAAQRGALYACPPKSLGGSPWSLACSPGAFQFQAHPGGQGCSHWTRRGSPWRHWGLHWSLVGSNWSYYGLYRGLRDSPWSCWGSNWICGLWRLTISHKRFPNITHPCKCYVDIQYVHFSMSKVISHSQKK